jgi:hypothetical protein
MPGSWIGKDDEQTSFTINGGLDAKGKPAPIDGNPTYTSPDDTVVTAVADSADPKKVNLVAGNPSALDDQGAPIPTMVKIEADGRVGDEVSLITDFISVIVTAGDATSFVLSQGPVEKQPA